ncbi:MAG: 6,7-dimethyl-8-ribityllumazine synthase [bacterium]|nr:6,7-dimethyl-8-ribityllumazine synthase [bacterium]
MKTAPIKKTTAPPRSRFAVVTARFNSEITQALREGAMTALGEAGVATARITQIAVPGSFELPWAAQHLAQNNRYDAIICLGALIKGKTDHYQYLAQSVSYGLQRVAIDTKVPVIFGVLTCQTLTLARARTRGKHNKGYEAGWTAVEMARIHQA